tara:strand:- start:1707 stop:2042 length:336 start_codon:yes stop_codon:yes gene_type:complete
MIADERRAPPQLAPPSPVAARRIFCPDCQLYALEGGNDASLSAWKKPKGGFWQWKTNKKTLRCTVCKKTYDTARQTKHRKVSQQLTRSRHASAPQCLHKHFVLLPSHNEQG